MTDAIAARLRDGRERTLEIFEPLDERAIGTPPDPIMSPPLWDLGHIGAYEELWLVRRLTGRPATYPSLDAVYDAFETPRAVRGDAPILGERECRSFLAQVRELALGSLAVADVSPEGPDLTARGFVFDMVALHEAQHTETVLQGLKMLPAGDYVPPRRVEAHVADHLPGPERVTIPAGPFTMGGDLETRFSYDCERPAHVRVLDEFQIARHPVTNGDWLQFMREGGYSRRSLWDDDGWAWRSEVDAASPAYWVREGEGGWVVREFERIGEPIAAAPVCHVCAHEADAFARWAGARLPTEAEWEAAARWSGAEEVPGELDQLGFGPGSGGAPNPGRCEGMIGDVWEWTASGFGAYPGFRAYPYREYAEVFFGGPYRVLRGGSWATRAPAVSATFRNWDLPRRRQIFSGLRLAWDAP